MEQVVVGEALAGCLLLQAIQIELTVCLQLGREPGQERHPGLIVRCELVGGAVQIEPHGAEGFAVIRQIDQPHVVLALQALELVDELGQHLVGVADGVVIGVHQLFVAAVLDVAARAVRQEDAIGGRVAAIVGRTVAAHQVEGHQLAALLALHVGDLLIQPLQQHLVMTGIAGAVCGECLGLNLDGGDVFAHPLAAAVVFLPEHRDPGMLQHVQQAVLGLGPGLVIAAPGHVREHAGHGERRGGAAGAHVPERDHIGLLLGEAVGLLLVAVEGVVLAAGRLPHHQEHQGRLLMLADHPGIGADLLVGNGSGEDHIPGVLVEPVHIVGGHYLLAEGLVVAPDRGVILVIEGGSPHQKQQGEGDGTEAQTQSLVPGTGILNLHPQQDQHRQQAGQQEPEHHGAVEVGARLPAVGLDDVLHHAHVEDHPVLEHGVADQGAGQDEQGEKGLEQITEGKGQEHRVEGRHQYQGNGKDKPRLDVFKGAENAIKVQENGPVEDQCKQQHQQQIDLHHSQSETHRETPTNQWN